MRLPGPYIPQEHLQPSEMLRVQEPKWILTLLGSCVAVTMFSPRLRLAAICHAMLPRPHFTDTSAKGSYRYLSEVVPAMSNWFLHHGIGPAELEVKMFGGANVINLGGEPHRNHLIGSANVSAARELLESAGLRLQAENVGGVRGCKIAFNTWTGEVLHWNLRRPSQAL